MKGLENCWKFVSMITCTAHQTSVSARALCTRLLSQHVPYPLHVQCAPDFCLSACPILATPRAVCTRLLSQRVNCAPDFCLSTCPSHSTCSVHQISVSARAPSSPLHVQCAPDFCLSACHILSNPRAVCTRLLSQRVPYPIHSTCSVHQTSVSARALFYPLHVVCAARSLDCFKIPALIIIRRRILVIIKGVSIAPVYHTRCER